MGCDIHMFVEFGRGEYNGEQQWDCFGGHYNPGRDYHMFGIMAGVRVDEVALFEPRGLPEGPMSWEAQDELKEDNDLHSHSWLTGDEYIQCYAQRMLTNEWGPPDTGYEMIMILLHALKERDIPCRVVFAFDN